MDESQDEKKSSKNGISRRQWLAMTGTAAASLTAGYFTLNSGTLAPAEPTAADFIAQLRKDGHLIPVLLQEISGLETQLASAADPDEKSLLRSQIRCKQYLGIRDGSLPMDYVNHVVAIISPEYDMLRDRADDATQSIDSRNSINQKLENIERKTGLPLPQLNETRYWGKYNAAISGLRLPTAIMMAASAIPANAGQLGYYDRLIDAQHAIGTQALEALATVEKLQKMAEAGSLSIASEPRLQQGLRSRSVDPREYGTPHSSMNQSRENLTDTVGAIRVTGADGTQLDVPLTKPSLGILSNALMELNPIFSAEPLSETTKLELKQVANAAYKAVNGPSPTP